MNFLPVKVTATAIEQVQVELPNRQQVWLPVDSANVQVGANMSSVFVLSIYCPAISPM
jgi:multiple sugar transport system ATP-binding protein